MMVTIYTDASYKIHNGQANRGAWAFFAKCSHGESRGAGKIPESRMRRDIKGSTDAEMFAICQAIWSVHKKWPDVKGFFVNTDSLYCCQVVWPFRDRGGHPEVKEMFRKLTTQLPKDIWFRFKHVRAHQKSHNVRAYLNNLCDAMAKEARQR